MRTKTRLTLWLGLVTLLVLVLGGIALGTIWSLRSEGRDVMKANYNSIAYAQRMLEAMDGPLDTALTGLDAGLAFQQANVTEQGEAGLTDSLQRHIHAFRAAPSEAVKRELRGDLNRIIEVNRAAIVRKAADSEARAENAVLWISAAGTLCFVIVFTLFLSLPERLAEPIRKLTEGIDRIAEGNYRERVELEGSGEFAHMAQRFNAMAGELERWESSNLARIMEEKTRAEAVINSLKDASIGVDEEGRLLFMNRQALELLGLEEDEVAGRSAREVAQRNDLFRHIVDQQATTPFKATLGDKEHYFVGASASIEGAEGALGTVYTVRDITPFQERDQAKTNFLATISHELKTPLASTDIGLTLLERQREVSASADLGAIITDLRKDHQRLVRIVSELLDLAQAETGHIRLSIQPVDISGIIEPAMAAVASSARQKDIRFDVQAGSLPTVRADADKAVWALVNLLSNAVRYSPDHGVIILKARQQDGEVAITVVDQGPGIAEVDRRTVFDRFAHPSTPPHGTGLGLSIAREFMRSMGGEITLDPSTGGGASFTLHFPVAG